MDIRKIREELPELAFLIWHVQGEEGCGLASSLSSRDADEGPRSSQKHKCQYGRCKDKANREIKKKNAFSEKIESYIFVNE